LKTAVIFRFPQNWVYS